MHIIINLLWYFIDQFLSSINITDNTKWKQTGLIIAGGNGRGNQLNQLAMPMGIYINDNDQSIYIAEGANHRIVKWKYGAKTGEVVAGGNSPGTQMNPLSFIITMIVDEIDDSLITCEWGSARIQRLSLQNQTNQQTIISNIRCFGLAIDNNGDLYAADNVNHTVTRWREGDTNGTIVVGGNGRGDQLNQLNAPTFIFIDEDYSIYVSDSENHRVIKWVNGAIEGIVVAGGQGHGNNLTQLFHPRGVIVDHLGNVYVADYGNHRIMRWLKGAKEGSIVVGRYGPGEGLNQLYHPCGISFDQQGNLYVASQSMSRVQKFHVSIY